MSIQRDEAWLKAATPAEIAAAHQAGELAVLMGGKDAPFEVPAEGQLTGEHTANMSPAQINAAHKAGRLNELLGRPVPPPSPAPAGAAPEPAPATPAAPALPVYIPPADLVAQTQAWPG